MALSMLATAQAAPAAAADAGLNSDYFGESAFLNLAPGQAGQFAVGFNNTGNLGWQTGTATQIDLAICLEDKTTCSVTSPNAAWANNWYSSIAYASQSTNFVAPGQTGWFVYSVRVPVGTATGTTARFNGDLVQHSNNQKVRPQGYYQDATASGTATVPTALTLTPAFQGRQIGQTATVTANVTADPPTGSTTRQPVQNQEVTFQIVDSGAQPLNGPITGTSISDASGNASFSYTRNNPGTDNITAYVTGAPTVRGTATASWGTSATTITVTPTAASTKPNTDVDDVTATTGAACTTYSFTAKDLNGNPIVSTGVAGTATLRANFAENTATADNDGGATINGTSPTSSTNNVPIASAADGTGNFAVCAGSATNTKTVTPILFNDANTNTLRDTNELTGAGGSITYQTRTPIVATTPDTAASMAVNGQRVYTVTATDQFGAAYRLGLTLGTVENTDNTVATSSAAIVAWADNRTSATGVPSTTAQAGCGAAPAGATPGVLGGASAVVAPNSSGLLTFALCSTTATTGTAVAFRDTDANGVRAVDEAGDTGGTTTWAAAAITTCTLTVNKATAPTSAAADTTVASPGDVTYAFTLRDQSGNGIAGTGTATLTISNTGTTGFVASGGSLVNNTAVATGASVSSTFTNPGAGGVAVFLDSVNATSASVTGSFVPATGSTVTCGPTTNNWISATDAGTLAPGSIVTGTVIFVDKTADPDVAGPCTSATTDGCGAYVLQTSASGNFYVTFDTTDTFTIVGTTSTGVQFEAALSVGDVITLTTAAAQPAGVWNHNMTTNAP
jgi:hypothetical protein